MGYIACSPEAAMDPPAATDAPRTVPTKLPTPFLKACLSYWHTADEDDLYELDDIPERALFELAGSQTALLAACVSTDVEAQWLRPAGPELENDLSRLLLHALKQVVCRASPTGMPADQPDPHIILMDWEDAFRICAVAWTTRGETALSFASVPLHDVRQHDGFGTRALREQLASVLHEAYANAARFVVLERVRFSSVPKPHAASSHEDSDDMMAAACPRPGLSDAPPLQSPTSFAFEPHPPGPSVPFPLSAAGDFDELSHALGASSPEDSEDDLISPSPVSGHSLSGPRPLTGTYQSYVPPFADGSPTAPPPSLWPSTTSSMSEQLPTAAPGAPPPPLPAPEGPYAPPPRPPASSVFTSAAGSVVPPSVPSTYSPFQAPPPAGEGPLFDFDAPPPTAGPSDAPPPSGSSMSGFGVPPHGKDGRPPPPPTPALFGFAPAAGAPPPFEPALSGAPPPWDPVPRPPPPAFSAFGAPVPPPPPPPPVSSPFGTLVPPPPFAASAVAGSTIPSPYAASAGAGLPQPAGAAAGAAAPQPSWAPPIQVAPPQGLFTNTFGSPSPGQQARPGLSPYNPFPAGASTAHFFGQLKPTAMLPMYPQGMSGVTGTQVQMEQMQAQTEPVIKKVMRYASAVEKSSRSLSEGGLNTSEACVVGKFFRSVRYEARNGELVIAFKSRIRPQTGGVDLSAEVGMGLDLLPSASMGVGTTIYRRQNVMLTGTAAWNKVVTEMKMFEKIRKWFLSCLIRGTILLNERSGNDGFIPELVGRGGLDTNVLREPVCLRFLEELGGRLFSMGEAVLFQSHRFDDCRRVMGVGAGGILSVGKRFDGELLDGEEGVETVWTSERLRIGNSH